jgi:hypothetical protein
MVAHGVSRVESARSPGTGRKKRLGAGGRAHSYVMPLTPRSGARSAHHLFPTACAVGYALAPSGLLLPEPHGSEGRSRSCPRKPA